MIMYYIMYYIKLKLLIIHYIKCKIYNNKQEEKHRYYNCTIIRY